jgi:twitching motility protein PilJ
MSQVLDQPTVNGKSSEIKDSQSLKQYGLPPHLSGQSKKSDGEKKEGKPSPSLPALNKIGTGSQSQTLRAQLLSNVLPVVLIPLVATGVFAGVTTYQKSYRQAESAINDSTLEAAESIAVIVDEESDFVAATAANPLLVSAARSATIQADEAQLSALTVDQVEAQFDQTKLLNPNQQLNDYLRKVVELGGLGELFFTSQQGFNVAYSNITGDFFQADEEWWQQAKSEGLVIPDPKPDESAGLAAGVEINVPLQDANTGEFLGVMKGVFDSTNFDNPIVQEVQRVVNLLGGRGSLTVQILGSDNTVFRTLTANGSLEEYDLIGGETTLEKVLAFRNQTPDSNAENQGQSGSLFSYNGLLYHLAKVPGTQWVVVSSIEESALGSQARDLSLIYLIVTPILGILAVAVLVALSRRLSDPLINLAGTASLVAEGNLDAKAEITGVRETRTLAETFNTLVTRVKDLLKSQEEAAEQQLAAQAEIARQQEENARQQQEAKEFLQNRALELLMEVSPLRQGDLTIRAKVTEDEIGTIADSYNATIASLRKIATQVQGAAGKVNSTTKTNEGSLEELAKDAVLQAEAIQAALSRIDEMNSSIQQVAQSAQEAEEAVHVANQTVQQGDQAMNRTVEGIITIRETVAETAKKVKQLGESSQKISKVVNLIGTFAAQTNLLALNASIEAARAGEEGRGFAVVADEVRSLARQSAQATAEIEQLVASIQTETNEVVAAMESGTQQVVEGTRLVEETRQSLTQIAQVSQKISQLVQSISEAALTQSQSSGQVSQSMAEVEGVATSTSHRAQQVLTAFQELLTVAEDLQATVGQFKLN